MNTGKWTSKEHLLYIEGLLLYGRDFKKIQKHIKTRNTTQIRTHDQKYSKKLRNFELDAINGLLLLKKTR
jgi:SHAQKYF class myb-like DNA-binding protein